ncbi:hypothetical protein OEA41_008420 [Lepraria neglecta]|uniref:DUF7924 domain-containing protein n=1 Tax=Lepraria neglecta TaxID=209136 RepID=A0AAD9ZF35_9LECA|nr:hypothetical protein OEA41_008420 [Lepraria neglecta]
MPQAQKRKRALSHDPCVDEQNPSTRPRASPKSHEQVAEHPDDPVAHWVATTFWPKAFGKEGFRMNQGNSTKRKGVSMHNSDRMERLAKNGIYMRASALMQRTSKDLCSSFLEGDRTPSQYPCYPPEQIPNILEHIQDLSEGRLQRDITPWVVPSAENLFFSGEITLDYIGEEIQADWTGCATMGDTRPKPAYTAGLSRTAFTKEEIGKLENYTSFERPFLFTPNLCFPFLICEAKIRYEGVYKADRQNIHSASIAVGAIIELYKAAFGTTYPDRMNELNGQVLAFSVSHNNTLVNLYGHYAVLSDDSTRKPSFYRYDIEMFGLTIRDGADRYKAYNFVYNVYEKFAPEHRKRIKDAVASLPALAERTGLMFAASDLALEDTTSQQNSQVAGSQDDGGFRAPSEPASVTKIRQMEEEKKQVQAKIRQMEEEKKESKKREEKLEEQVMAKIRQMEEEKKETKEREEKLEERVTKLIELLSAASHQASPADRAT